MERLQALLGVAAQPEHRFKLAKGILNTKTLRNRERPNP
jgi:hypothetical protein